MNWSVYSKFIGNVFGAPLAIEGLAAFFLESTFLGLWIFGWDRLSPRLHLATLWIAVIGTWLSAYFILVANSFMQEPVGYKLVNGQAVLTSIWALLSSHWAALRVRPHDARGADLSAPRSCSASAAGTSPAAATRQLFRPAAKLALIVLVPVASINMWFGSHFGILVTQLQPMKISAAEAQWDTCTECSFSLFQIGGFSSSDPTPSFSIAIPGLLSYLSTGSFSGQVQGLNELNKQYVARYGPGNYEPPVRAIYWSMRGMAYAGSFVALDRDPRRAAAVEAAARAAKLVPLDRQSCAIFLPFIACVFGWCLTEIGRQPWIVQGLLKTVDANSPARERRPGSAISLTVFVALYVALLVLDFWLMRRYAGRDPEDPGEERVRRLGGAGDRLLMDLQNLWFVLIVVLWSGYFLLEGFDFGVGMLLPFLPRDEQERSAMFASIGPVWDGNEVWLVCAGGRRSRPSRPGTRRCSRASTSRCWPCSSS